MNAYPKANGNNINKGFIAALALLMSLAFSVKANAVVTVANPPTDTTIAEGQSYTFELNAVSSNRLIRNHWWYKNGVQVGTAPKFWITKATQANAGTYSCKVSDGKSIYYCKSFVVTIGQNVSITSQPSSTIVNEGSPASMSVAATGTGTLSYQWYFGGTAIPGATMSSISTAAATLADAGSYYCVVKSSSSTVTSSTATMSVLAKPKTYSVALSWTRPTTRTDGTSLTSSDISGYNIYYGTSSTGTLTRIASVAGSSLTYTASNLSTGTHYFAASTIDSTGQESNISTRVSRTLQ
jgi:hypothetical protein